MDRRGLDGSHLVYRNFTGPLQPYVAARCLIFMMCILVLGETACRLLPHRYARSAISSLHGVRSIYQEALADPNLKEIAVGDSSFIGGGVHDHESIFIQKVQQDVSKIPIYNLAQPGGDNLSGLMVLKALARDRICCVDRVIIEVLPGKFIENVGSDPPPFSWSGTPEELIHFIPETNGTETGVPPYISSAHAQVQNWLEFKLGQMSALFARRDYFRIEYIGNYPIFYGINAVLPSRLKARLLHGSFRGTNRLGARVEDFPFLPTNAVVDGQFRFNDTPQGAWLQQELYAAKAISRRPPIVIVHPEHYKYHLLTPAATLSYERALSDANEAFNRLCLKEGAMLFVVDSTKYQDPSLWFQTHAHFNEKGHEKIYKEIGPAIVKALMNDAK